MKAPFSGNQGEIFHNSQLLLTWEPSLSFISSRRRRRSGPGGRNNHSCCQETDGPPRPIGCLRRSLGADGRRRPRRTPSGGRRWLYRPPEQPVRFRTAAFFRWGRAPAVPAASRAEPEGRGRPLRRREWRTAVGARDGGTSAALTSAPRRLKTPAV